jgi:hypothetical protein
MNLTIVGVAVVLSTAIVAAIDAASLGLGRKDGPVPNAFGPFGAFFGIALLWIIIYPVYMSHRGKAGVSSWLALALLGVIAFAASAGYMALLIEEGMREFQRAFGG